MVETNDLGKLRMNLTANRNSGCCIDGAIVHGLNKVYTAQSVISEINTPTHYTLGDAYINIYIQTFI